MKRRLPELSSFLNFERKKHIVHSLNSKEDQKKVRQVPHIEGNFPSHVRLLLSIRSDEQKEIFDYFNRISKKICKKFAGNARYYPFSISEFHISLSKDFYLQKHQIHSFSSALMKIFQKDTQKIESITFGDFQIFSNDDHSREFFALVIKEGKNKVCTIINQINQTMKAFKCPEYYKHPTPHLSIGWTHSIKAPNVVYETCHKDFLEYSLAIPLISFQISKIELLIGKWAFTLFEK